MKRWLRRLYVLAVLGAATGMGLQAYGQSPLARLMRDKLTFTQRLLEGIALSDFAKIQKNAEELVTMSNTEEWLAYKTPRYAMQSDAFRDAAETIARKAKVKDIDGVTQAYAKMTISCVRCHEHVREVRDARLPLTPPAVALIERARP